MDVDSFEPTIRIVLWSCKIIYTYMLAPCGSLHNLHYLELSPFILYYFMYFHLIYFTILDSAIVKFSFTLLTSFLTFTKAQYLRIYLMLYCVWFCMLH